LRFQEGLRPFERLFGIAVLRLQLIYGRLVRVDLRLKWRLLEEVQEIALFNLGALDKESLFQECIDPGNERHPPHRLDTADELIGLNDLLPRGAYHPDCRRPAGRGLRRGRCSKY
jgi:hypothetical protein